MIIASVEKEPFLAFLKVRSLNDVSLIISIITDDRENLRAP